MFHFGLSGNGIAVPQLSAFPPLLSALPLLLDQEARVLAQYSAEIDSGP